MDRQFCLPFQSKIGLGRDQQAQVWGQHHRPETMNSSSPDRTSGQNSRRMPGAHHSMVTRSPVAALANSGSRAQPCFPNPAQGEVMCERCGQQHAWNLILWTVTTAIRQ